MVKWPLLKRSDGSRVVVKVNSLLVQWWTDKIFSSLKALMGGAVSKQGLEKFSVSLVAESA